MNALEIFRLERQKLRMKKYLSLVILIALVTMISLPLSSCGSDSGESGELNIFNFGDYIDPTLISQFEEETGINVNYSEYDTNEELYPVISTGSADYDIICASDYMITRMIDESLIQEINFDNIPNYKNIDQIYRELAGTYDEVGSYSIPHMAGTMGIAYNSEIIPEGEITSWNDLWDPKYADKVIMNDSMRDTLAIALKAKGYSVNTLDETELSDATDYLIEQKPMVYKYANDSARDFLIGETAALGVVWNGELLYMQDLNDKIEFVIPDEGSTFFIDAWAITANAKNVSNAEKWFDFMLREDVAYTNFEYLTYTIPNTAAVEMISDDLVSNEVLFPPQEVMEKCETLKSLGVDADEMYSDYWKKYKAE